MTVSCMADGMAWTISNVVITKPANETITHSTRPVLFRSTASVRVKARVAVFAVRVVSVMPPSYQAIVMTKRVIPLWSMAGGVAETLSGAFVERH